MNNQCQVTKLISYILGKLLHSRMIRHIGICHSWRDNVTINQSTQCNYFNHCSIPLSFLQTNLKKIPSKIKSIVRKIKSNSVDKPPSSSFPLNKDPGNIIVYSINMFNTFSFNLFRHQFTKTDINWDESLIELIQNIKRLNSQHQIKGY